MKNRDIALQLVEKLKTKRKSLAETAEYLMSVESFRYEDVCRELGIVKYVAYNRINYLKNKGFIFKYLSRTPTDGGTFSLVDCLECVPKKRKPPTMPEEKAIKLVFVDKSDVQIPEYPYLWKIAFGLIDADL